MTTYKCNKCDKIFATKSSLGQHCRDANHQGGGGGGAHGLSHSHNPPHDDIQGYWIDRNRFRGDKSFGCFQCDDCSKEWSSAHAFRGFKQGCQACETYSYPCCLWVNTDHSNGRDQGFDDDDDNKPHDAGRCEACREGHCRMA